MLRWSLQCGMDGRCVSSIFIEPIFSLLHSYLLLYSFMQFAIVLLHFSFHIFLPWFFWNTWQYKSGRLNLLLMEVSFAASPVTNPAHLLLDYCLGTHFKGCTRMQQVLACMDWNKLIFPCVLSIVLIFFVDWRVWTKHAKMVSVGILISTWPMFLVAVRFRTWRKKHWGTSIW
jgi:hypothetical protein